MYLAGILALQLLTGDKFIKLFKGMDRKRQKDPVAWSAWHASSEPIAPVHSIIADLPSDLSALIHGLTQKQVGLRFASATEALGTICSQAAPSTSNGLTEEDRSAQGEKANTEGLTVTYNSPNLFVPQSALQPKKKQTSWQEWVQAAIRRYPVMRNPKAIVGAGTLAAKVSFC